MIILCGGYPPIEKLLKRRGDRTTRGDLEVRGGPRCLGPVWATSAAAWYRQAFGIGMRWVLRLSACRYQAAADTKRLMILTACGYPAHADL